MKHYDKAKEYCEICGVRATTWLHDTQSWPEADYLVYATIPPIHAFCEQHQRESVDQRIDIEHLITHNAVLQAEVDAWRMKPLVAQLAEQNHELARLRALLAYSGIVC